MDTSARRFLWDMLRNYKNNRIVILTTHFMDEADYLGGRIGIMADGELRCCGRSLFLKSKYGVGYTLTVVRKTPSTSNDIENFVKRYVPSAKTLSDVSVEVSLQLPLEEANHFGELFEEMDRQKANLNVDSYGVSVTTLEEVFLRIASDTNHLVKKQSKIQHDQHIQFDQDEDLDHTERIKPGIQLFFTHFWAMILKRVWYFKRDTLGLLCEVLVPIAIVAIGFFLMLLTFFNDSPEVIAKPTIYKNPILAYYGSNVTLPAQFISDGFSTDYYQMNRVEAPSFEQFDVEVFNRRGNEPFRIGAFYFTEFDTTNLRFQYNLEVNTTHLEAAPFWYNQINSAILKRSLNNPSAKIELTISPFPLTSQIKKISSSVDGVVATFVFGLSMAFIPASLISFIVKEREQNIKHQQVVSGLYLPAYWFANLLIDMLKHTIIALSAIGLAKLFSADSLTQDDSLSMLFAIFFFYGTSMAAFTYLSSFMFKDFGKAQTVMFIFAFLIGFLGSLIVFILRLIEVTKTIGKVLAWILRLVPNFSFCFGILNVSNRDLYRLLWKEQTTRSAWDVEIALADFLYLLLTSIFYFILVFVIEYVRIRPSTLNSITRDGAVPRKNLEFDNDVAAERQTVESANPRDYSVLVNDMRKVYSLGVNRHKVAVESVSFGIKKGECFALLGVNGAGKTTTFRILSGEYTQTSGKAFISGYDTTTNMRDIRQYIGYCPQFDALLPNLTSKEHLYIYAAIKGIPAKYRDRVVQQKIAEMDLKNFENVPAGTYSGGNKRKLSVALAMIGNPPIILLDEPSSGMDPAARRFMWNVISNITTQKKESSIILTTHAMDEAEALSTKMAIMVDGQFKCMGSVQHIKNKFGKGYELEIKTTAPTDEECSRFLSQIGVNSVSMNQNEVVETLKRANCEYLIPQLSHNGTGSTVFAEIHQNGSVRTSKVAEYILIEQQNRSIYAFLQREFGEFILIEQIQTFLRFKIDSTMGLGKIFGQVEKNKQNLKIQQYSLKQTSIEQIFNMFAMNKAHLGIRTNQ
eukprot:TRINITY_DN8255_c0_g2_i3.p1 TRINITY_DN8255_c0_g2~~TRINITY_DN8255_c0_g2_i3.p1  ORF type:complete len:1028 (+),score=239.16 TRINITY_DN8255_c0_g2_i3:182-3265(+)